MQAGTYNSNPSQHEVGRKGMSIQLFLSGVMLGLLVGMLLGCRLSHRLQHREGKQGEIDRLVRQFQELFRQIDQDKEI
jgi:hypothetical protein